VTVVGILWVVLTPYLTGLLIAGSRRANRLVTRNLRASTVLGWGGLAALFTGVFAIGGHDGMLIAVLSAPLTGLAFWKTQPGDDGGDGRAPDPDAGPPAPDRVRRTRRRLPAPPRTRPTGHGPAPRRTPARARGRTNDPG
jgi:hypothetical protein